MRSTVIPSEATKRLELIFPRAAFDSTFSGDLAGWAVASLIYMDAVAPEGLDPPVWARPTSIIWQQAEILETRVSDEDRLAWRGAAAVGKTKTTELLDRWNILPNPRFRENSRETLRDEILSGWRDLGVVRQRAGLATSSSRPRWALEEHFALLFDPNIVETDLLDVVHEWTAKHLDVGARLKALQARKFEAEQFEVSVKLPNGKVRSLESGKSSLILKGVIEEWAVRRLAQPVVLTISEPGDKLMVEDQVLLAQLGVAIDVGNLLPDALIVDIGVSPARFWIIEAVATDGPINDVRKQQLLAWAKEQRIEPTSCSFLTAFASRNAAPVKRRLKDLAAGTYAWFLDEPDFELYWHRIAGSQGNIPEKRPLEG